MAPYRICRNKTKAKVNVLYGFAFAMALLLSNSYAAEGPIELRVAVNFQGKFHIPLNRTLEIREGTLPFRIILKNISGSSQKLYESYSDEYSPVEIEVKQSDGRVQIIRRKRKDSYATFQQFDYMAPGEIVVHDMIFDPLEWEGVNDLDRAIKPIKYKVRVIYRNDIQKIYSDYYDVHIY